MTWNELKAQLPMKCAGGTGDPRITDVTCDSRTVAPGSLFVSIPGFRVNGDEFIRGAIDKGASAVLSEKAQPQCPVPWAQIDNTRKSLGAISRLVFGIDLSAVTMVGITGTNGKTTTAHLFKSLLSQLYGERDTWMFGTIKYHAAGTTRAALNTTPEAASIFRQMWTAGHKPKAVVMEVSSHSLALDRVSGLLYDCAIFTNLTQDHLDFHETMENYYQAKKLLFVNYLKAKGSAVINIDDPYGAKLSQELAPARVVTFGKNTTADVCITGWDCSWDSTAVSLNVAGTPLTVSSKLAGFFNVYNITALVAGAHALGISMDAVKQGLDAVDTVAGRMDRVPLEDAPFSVFVDYAHTPDALVNVLSTVKNLTRGRLICVFGCGGDRDKTKRPLMAQAVAQNADEAVVTSDNPRSEDPHAILRDVLAGMPLDFPHTVLADRKEAIRKALRIARPGDCVVIAGKGHEDYQEVKGVRHHFDDKEEVVAAYREMRGNGN
jgi:UDP-N-acetylmuramoyl-L-alanyl-D-glutamate--2,6-diaminopimelate ligase